MSTTIGALRRRFLAPSLSKVSFRSRGFPDAHPTEAMRLESIPQAVVCGFEWGIDADGLWEIESRLNLVEPELRGFAYEGVTMAFTILDAFPGGRGTRAEELLLGPAQPHIFLSYIGIGFAMARLPRMLWQKLVPDLSGSPYYPTMSWLAVDGYGFDLAYFDTRRWVAEQEVPSPYPWDGAPRYFLRAVDQGIGRALWFIQRARPSAVAAAIQSFAAHRQPDLWSGVGLAATFAGGCNADNFDELRQAARGHADQLALGVVFAVKARTYSGIVPPHTELAAASLAEISIGDAVALADSTSVADDHDGGVPPYELWRQRIREHFVSSSEPSRRRRENHRPSPQV